MKVELFRKLCMNFNKEPNEELYLLWKEQFDDYDPYYLEIVINNIIANDSYFPTISKVIEEFKKTNCKEIPVKEKERRKKEKNVIPNWLYKEIINQPINNEVEKKYNNFNSFLEEFRNAMVD